MTLLTGPRENNRPENNSRTFIILGEVGMQLVLHSYKMILTKSHTVWHTINANLATSVYFTDWSDWSVNYCKSLHLLVCQVPDMEES